MRKRPLGKTGLQASELALGTWGLSGDGYGPVDAETAAKVVTRALEIGVTTFETADAYGAGKMEALLGRLVPKNADVLIVTKGGIDRTTEPPQKRFDPEYLEKAVVASLKRLQRERIDLFLLHHPSADAIHEGTAVQAVTALKEKGLIGHWGVAAGDVEVARVGIEKGAEVIELAYNLFHSIDLHRLAGELMVGQVGVLVRSTLSYGLLAGLWSRDRVFEEGDHRRDRWTRAELTRRVEQLEAVRFLVKGDVRTPRAAAVRFALANHLVGGAVLGPRSVEQLEQLVREVGSGPVYLADSDLAALPPRAFAARHPDVSRLDYAAMLTDVLAIAERAGKVVMDVYATKFDVDFKEKDDPVTRADKEANALICAALEAAYPGIPIVAEESDPSAYLGYAAAPAAWFVDPLDGTREFVKHNGEFAVMIGLAEGGEATLGVIVCPALERSFVGAKGGGAFEIAKDGSRRPIHVSPAKTLADAELVVSRSHRTGNLEETAVRLGFRAVTHCGSAGVKATRIAAGESDVYAQPGRAGALWDACAPEALVKAAGGAVTDAHGTTIDYAARELPNHHGFVATNGFLHADVLDLLRRFVPPAPSSASLGETP